MKSALHRIAGGLRNYFGKPAEKYPVEWQTDREFTRFGDVHRRIVIYLHALLGRDFALKRIDDDDKGYEKFPPFIENRLIHLPPYYYDFKLDNGNCVTAAEAFRAASVHAAAHVVYSRPPLAEKSLGKWQKAVVSVIEDARVEALLLREFPLLKPLWSAQHAATPLQNRTAGDYLNRLARALLDETYRDDDPWVCEGRALFAATENLEADGTALRIGLALAQSFELKSIRFNAHADRLTVPYRDDNRYLWVQLKQEQGPQELPTAFFDSKLLAGNNEFASEDDEDKPLSEEKPRRGRGTPDTYSYPEWNYRSQVETPCWVTVREKRPEPGDIEVVRDIVVQNSDLVTRMKNLLLSIRLCGVRRIRKLEEGDEIDINAAIRAVIDIGQGVQPDTRIMMRSARKTRDIAVLVLLDLSNSTNQKIAGQEHTVLQLTQQISVLFAEVIQAVGDPFAIHGFCSRSRHNVEYFRFKDFDQPYDDASRASIAGMKGHDSTRMGAAIRHATHHLNGQAATRKLLMLVTDGAPSDVDVRGTNYLLYDAKMAVGETGRNGIHSYCISLDPDADEYVSRIFGAKSYMVVDHVRSLPEKMLTIYAGLTA